MTTAREAGRRLAGEAPQLPESLWARISLPAIAAPPLAGEVRADVAVIGGGFAGCAAALALAQAGQRVVILEAAEPGWGASGRNNGQVIPGLKFDPDELVRRFGAARGGRLAAWAGALPDRVFSLIAEHGIACDPVRSGWIQPAYTRRALATIESRCAQWAARAAPVRMLSSDELEPMLGTPRFVGAWMDRRGGTINPLSYARGLAGAAQGAGAALHARTPALSMTRDGGAWVVQTPAGSVRAGQVFVATAAYADDLVPGLRRSTVPVRTAQVATTPLPEVALRAILPGGQGASDTRRLLTSFRISPDRRLVMGGAWATGGLDDRHLLPHLHRAAADLFGHLGPLRWEFGWSGFFPVTDDHLPHVHESTDGIICALGCNGRGIGLSTALGEMVAARLLGREADALEIPPSPMPAVAFHEFRRAGIAAATLAKSLQDRLDRALTK